MTTSTYTVIGMTCGHCVSAVKNEVGALDQVRDVAVDLTSGRLTVTSDVPVDAAEVRRAVDEAGYQLADPDETGMS